MAEATQASAALQPARYLRTGVQHRFVSDVAYFTTANILYLAVTAFTTFLIPRILSVEVFGAYRLFLLYAGYVGVLHLGYLDGALVSWARKGPDLIAPEIPEAFTFVSAVLCGFALIGIALWFVVSQASWSWLIPYLLIFAVFANLLTVAQYALQGEKRFRFLSVLTVLTPFLLLGSVAALAVAHTVSVHSLITCYLGINFAILVLSVLALRRMPHALPQSTRIGSNYLPYLRLGFPILAANVIANLFVSIDGLAISSHFTIRQFAIYSFAATFSSSGFAVVLAVAKVAFPYASTHVLRRDWKPMYSAAQSAVLAIWTLGIATYFPIAWITRAVLPAYVESLPLVRILLVCTGALAATQVVHFNLFRLAQRTGIMLAVSATALVVRIATLPLLIVYDSLELIAWTAVSVVILRWVLGEMILANIIGQPFVSSAKRLSYIIFVSVGFVLCTADTRLFNFVLYVVFSTTVAYFAIRPHIALLRTPGPELDVPNKMAVLQ